MRLKKLLFSDNNIHSFIQISKLECLSQLNTLSIENNDVSKTILCRTFIVYRFPNVIEINGQSVTDQDRLKARQQFQHFDKILSTPNIFSPKPVPERPDQSKEERNQEAKNQRMQAKKNSEAAQNFYNGLVLNCIQRDQKVDELN